jgi:AraC-like DNA-binding protein
MVAGRPQARLSPFVARYTGYRIEGTPPGVHRGLPSRHLTCIVTLDGMVNITSMPSQAHLPRSFTTLVGGLHTSPALIRHNGYQHGIQLHLTPLGARALLGLPAGELANTVVDLNTLLGPVARELVERLRSASTWTGRFSELDSILIRIARQRDGPAPELRWAWQRLTDHHGRVEVATLAREVGWSRRHLGARFRREFGLTPKVAGRVMRFESHPPAAPCGESARPGRHRSPRRVLRPGPSAPRVARIGRLHPGTVAGGGVPICPRQAHRRR